MIRFPINTALDWTVQSNLGLVAAPVNAASHAQGLQFRHDDSAMTAAPRSAGPVSSGRSEVKREAVLDAATDVFVRAGYGAATMDEIARAANVSKQTIYHHFGSKEALFGAMVAERVRAFLAPLDLPLHGSDLRATLLRLGHTLLELALSRSSLALHRLIVGESARFPELGRISYERGALQAVRTLSRFFQRQVELGSLRDGDMDVAAERFLGMLMGHYQLRALLAPDDERQSDRSAWVEGAIDAFLAAHASRA
jgi:TetR/AcrR family transcriptional repressor of mexJK operon